MLKDTGKCRLSLQVSFFLRFEKMIQNVIKKNKSKKFFKITEKNFGFEKKMNVNYFKIVYCNTTDGYERK